MKCICTKSFYDGYTLWRGDTMGHTIISKDDILKYIRDCKVVKLSDLVQHFHYCPSTIFKKLKNTNYLSSYNVNGQFLTLIDIPEFDKNGLWSYQKALFSRHGGVRPTIQFIVNKSKAGLSAGEINEILQIRANNQFQLCLKERRVRRRRYGRYQIYFSSNIADFKMQIEKREKLILPHSEISKTALLPSTSPMTIENVHFGFLAQLIMNGTIIADDIYAMLDGMGKPIERKKIKEIIVRYDLEEKKTRIQLISPD